MMLLSGLLITFTYLSLTLNTDVLLTAPIQIDEKLKYVQNSQAQFTYTVPEKDITSKQ